MARFAMEASSEVFDCSLRLVPGRDLLLADSASKSSRTERREAHEPFT